MPPKKSTVKGLLLTQKAEVKEINLPVLGGTISYSAIQALLKKKEQPEVLGTYKYKSQHLFLFGYTTGKAGNENKHELPPPHDTTVCFGDILLLCTKDSKSWTNPLPFKMSDYEAFYTKAFGGFENLDSDEEDADAEPEVEEVEPEAEVEEEEEEEAEEAEESDTEVDMEHVEDAECAEEEVIPVRPVKKKKRAAAAPVIPGGAAEVYASYLHVPHQDELIPEIYEVPYDEKAVCPHRQKVIRSLNTVFGTLLTNDEIYKLERCIYNGTLREAGQRHIGKAWSHSPFVEMYQMFAKHIAANFHPNSYVDNTELYNRYKAGEITFKDISEMDTYQLFEERWKDSFMQQQVREKRQLEGNKSMATDQFLCMRCHKRECTYYEMQTRSADEPMTIFITCLNCGKHWRQ
jgi:DNA-directed RNA polymerase subunit M/transcription elongation factor TFIIS